MAHQRHLVFVLLACTFGCESQIELSLADDAVTPGDPNGPVLPTPHTRAARLTLREWENTVRDLLRLDDITGFSSQLPSDAAPAGYLFDNPSQALSVDQTQWAGFQRAAAAATSLVMDDPAALDRLLPPDNGDDDARATAFIIDFGRRAHRRPLSQADIDGYLQVYRVGRSNHADGSDFAGGVRLVIEAFLQSPFFLYRVELSSVAAGGVIPLTSYEMAQRLSYALWNTMPDDPLFEVAAADQLRTTEDIAAEARRMLDDDRATAMVDHVMGQLWERYRLNSVRPAPARYPDAPVDLGAMAREESQRFLAAQFQGGGSLADLLTSTQTFVNADLALIYGLEGDFGESFEPVELDPTTRRGLLTHVAFLAQNSTAFNPDPIHRGAFVARRLLCLDISAPPANLPPPPELEGPHTNRDVVEAHTQAPDSVCVGCHTYIINPFGFPFEMYDAVGAVQTTDNGLPINTATTPFIGGQEVPVGDALELTDRLVDNDAAHACFAQHWLSATLGRNTVPEDAPMLTRLTADSFDGQSVKDLLATLVSSGTFTARSTTELTGVSP
jgi:hypothetical protein